MNRQKYPRLQLRTVKELMDGQCIERSSNVAALDRQIDALVYELYALTADEIKIVEDAAK